MQSIHATFQRGVFRPVEPVELPDGCEVELQIISPPTCSAEAKQSAALSNSMAIEEQLARLADKVPLQDWEALPTDLSDKLDDYLYGITEE